MNLENVLFALLMIPIIAALWICVIGLWLQIRKYFKEETK